MLKVSRLLLFFFLLQATEKAGAQIKLPCLLRDSMVLQRNAKINIWGWAAPNEKLTIHFNKKKFKTVANANGNWQMQLPPMQAGGPYSMAISASNKIVLKEILIGDVWVCAGQSNMVHQMELHNITYANDIATANYPNIRHFFIPTTTNLQGPQPDLAGGNWRSAIPEDVPRFSAVAYFFAKKIYDKYGLPIGLINASVGGTPIEAWTSEEGLKDFSTLELAIQKNKDTAYVNNINRTATVANAASQPKPADKGSSDAVKWFEVSYKTKGWHPINIRGYWEDQGVKDLNGTVWYRKEIEVPASIVTRPAKVFLGRIVDADVLYINGVQVGQTTYQYPQRRYQLQPGVLKEGKNVFVIKVTNTAGKGGFVPDKPYYIQAGNETIDLKGEWQYKIGDVFAPRQLASGISAQSQPTALYNAMIAPLTNCGIKGFLWYQGESNAGAPNNYAALQAAQINDWRTKWKQGNLPFLFVQLPNFMDASYLPTESNWALMREAQLKTLAIPNTAMAVAIDLGEWNDIHPDNKKDVGERLALAALSLAYAEKNIVHSGPIFENQVIDGGKIILSFSNTGSGIISKDDEELRWFAIAGADKKFVWAKTKIEGNKILVWHDAVSRPMYVRYAWADNPVDVNFYNREGLPASPFRTDTSSP